MTTPSTAAPPRPAGFVLVVLRSEFEERVGQRIQLRDTPLRIGRSDECDLSLPSQTISRRHAELVPDGDGWTLRDLGSSNGVWLGERRITEHRLGDGDEFRIGGTVLRFEEVPLPAPVPPPTTSAPPPHQADAVMATQRPTPPAPPTVHPGQSSAPSPTPQPAPAAPAPPPSTAPLSAPTAPATPPAAAAPTPPNQPVEEDAPPDAPQPHASPLHQVLVREGEAMEASGNRPFLLASPGTAWYVETGKVEVFTVALDAGGQPHGPRTHFATVQQGEVMLGMDFTAWGLNSGFLAVGRMGTRLRRLATSRLQQLARQTQLADELAALVDRWIVNLSESLTREIAPGPVADVPLSEAGEAVIENRKAARPGRGVVWIEVLEGNLLFVGLEQLIFDQPTAGERAGAHSMAIKLGDLIERAQRRRALFPLTGFTWVEASNAREVATRVRCAPSAGVLGEAAAWRGLDVFHQVLCQCEFINKKLAVVDEYQRLKSKAEYSDAAREAGYREIASVMEETAAAAAAAAPGADPILTACSLVGEAMGMAIRDHPEAAKGASFEDRVNAIAKASRCRTRPVMLRDDWWRADQGPALGRFEDGGAPVALLPDGPRRMVAVDPRTGERVLITEEVAAQISPQAVVFYRPFPDGPLSVKDLIRFGARGLAGDLWMLIGMGISLGVLGALTPYFTGRLFDSAIPQADRNLLVQFTGALFIAAFAAAAFKLTQSIAVLRIQGRMDYSIQAALWDRLLNLPSNAFREYSSGDLADRAAGVNEIRRLVAGAGIGAVLGSLSSVFYVVLMFKYSFALALLAIGLTLFYVACTTTFNYLQLRQQRQEMQVSGTITGMVLQFISGVGKLRVAGAENHAFRVWASLYARQRRLGFTIGKIKNAAQVFSAGFPVLASAAIFYTLVQQQEKALAAGTAASMSTGDFIAFAAAFGAFLAATQALGDASLDLLRVVPIYERMKPIITIPAELDETRAYPGRLRGEIEVSHVSFRYSEDGPWVLDDLSVKIRPGEMVAFVGGSGCGKSTLMRLLLGFETPQKGSVYFDGQDLASLDLREVRQQIGVVLQTSQLLPTDVGRNILGSTGLGLPDAWEAAALAGLAEDIQALPMGMHTYISEGGGGFSGGQQQKILIARALVRKPRILIFDEATSALDNRSQATVTESMERLQATRIVIAHRLSTIVNADRICYLEGGRIIEEGTFEELMALGGKFHALAKRQMA
jgi:NHLM bacteriocin system ABC transporter ATP-binding protein